MLGASIHRIQVLPPSLIELPMLLLTQVLELRPINTVLELSMNQLLSLVRQLNRPCSNASCTVSLVSFYEDTVFSTLSCWDR
jgi:hypothetical protein